MSFEAPVWLLTLLLVPLAFGGYLYLERRRARYAVSFTNVGVLAEVVERRSAWRRYLPLGLLLAAIGALCIAVARPTVSLAAPEERASVILVVDVSGSMRAEDVAPTRLDAAREAIRSFMDRSPDGLRIGLIAFSDEPQVIVPPTRDRELLGQGVELLTPGFGTAIGDAVVRAVELGQAIQNADAEAAPPEPSPTGDVKEPLTAILLLSDGSQTRGFVEPLDSAAEAKANNMPVYTISLGTDEGTIEVFRFGELQIIPVPPDRQTLAQIAEETGGQYFDAPDADQLKSVYGKLGSEVGRVDEPRQATVGFVLAGAALLVAAAVFSGVWIPRLP